MGHCLAERNVEEEVQAAELLRMAELDARRAVGEDLATEPCDQRERQAQARHPVQEIAPGGLNDHQQEEVAAEVDGGPPRLRRNEQRERDGAAQDLRRVHDKEHAKPTRLGSGRVAHVPAGKWSRPCAHTQVP